MGFVFSPSAKNLPYSCLVMSPKNNRCPRRFRWMGIRLVFFSSGRLIAREIAPEEVAQILPVVTIITTILYSIIYSGAPFKNQIIKNSNDKIVLACWKTNKMWTLDRCQWLWPLGTFCWTFSTFPDSHQCFL